MSIIVFTSIVVAVVMLAVAYFRRLDGMRSDVVIWLDASDDSMVELDGHGCVAVWRNKADNRWHLRQGVKSFRPRWRKP